MELEGVYALLLLLAVVVGWVAVEIRRVYVAVQPIADSRVVQALTRV